MGDVGIWLREKKGYEGRKLLLALLQVIRRELKLGCIKGQLLAIEATPSYKMGIPMSKQEMSSSRIN